jgi:hypothetical protein
MGKHNFGVKNENLLVQDVVGIRVVASVGFEELE